MHPCITDTHTQKSWCIYLTCSQDCLIFLCAFDLSVLTRHTKVQTARHVFPLRSKTIQKTDYVSLTQKGTVSTLCQCVHIEIEDSSKDSFLFLFLVSTELCSLCNWTHRRRTHRSRNTQWLGTIREHSVPCSVAWNDQGTNTQCPETLIALENSVFYNKVP